MLRQAYIMQKFRPPGGSFFAMHLGGRELCGDVAEDLPHALGIGVRLGKLCAQLLGLARKLVQIRAIYLRTFAAEGLAEIVGNVQPFWHKLEHIGGNVCRRADAKHNCVAGRDRDFRAVGCRAQGLALVSSRKQPGFDLGCRLAAKPRPIKAYVHALFLLREIAHGEIKVMACK